MGIMQQVELNLRELVRVLIFLQIQDFHLNFYPKSTQIEQIEHVIANEIISSHGIVSNLSQKRCYFYFISLECK